MKKKNTQGFGIKLKAQNRKKPIKAIIETEFDPTPPIRIRGVIRPDFTKPADNRWRVLEANKTITPFTLSLKERDVIRRLKQSHTRCKEVIVSLKNGRLMALMFNEFGDGKIE